MQSVVSTGGRWRMPLSEQVYLAVVVAACCAVLAVAVPLIVGKFFNVTIGAWQFVAAASIWYVGAISGSLIYITVPLYVAHGQTRREGFTTWVITGLGVIVTAAVVIAMGFPLERWFYRTQGFSGYLESISFANLLVSFLLAFAVFWVVGGSIGAALYRYRTWGWLSIPAGFAVLTLTGSFEQTGVKFFDLVAQVFPAAEIESMWAEGSLFLLVIAAGGWIVLRIVRDLTLRSH